jgi:transcriptional regulator with XRE-family HTH domain
MGMIIPTQCSRPHIARRIQGILRDRGWSQRALGRRAGFSTPSQLGNTLRRLEEGRDVELESVLAIADGASVSLRWLLSDDEASETPAAFLEADEPKLQRANRIHALRVILGASVEALADRCGLTAEMMRAIEAGSQPIDDRHGADGRTIRELIAGGLNLSMTDIDLYLCGGAALRDAAAWSRTPCRQPSAAAVASSQGRVPTWEDSLGRSFDGRRHTISDLDATRALQRNVGPLQALGVDLSGLARLTLDLAALVRMRERRAATADDVATCLAPVSRTAR